MAVPLNERPRIRDAAKNRMPLDGSDAQALEGALQQVERLYNELLMAVCRKHPGETRHETALRYIRSCERSAEQPAKCTRYGSQ